MHRISGLRHDESTRPRRDPAAGGGRSSPPKAPCLGTMFPDTTTYWIGRATSLVLSALAMILVAAASELEVNWGRLRAMPPEERSRLLNNLRKFDLELSPEQQTAVRELDRRLSELPANERDHYFSVLRRYHAWLNGLPEIRQGELASKPTGERMALVRQVLRERPVPNGETSLILRVIEPGEFSPFEVATAYKVWQALDANQRAQVERKDQEKARRETLFRIGEQKKHIPRETVPDDFDEERWIGLVQEHWRQTRPIFQMNEMAKNKLEESARKRLEIFRREFLRRQAINLYVSRAAIHAVDADRLSRFVSSLPVWVQASFQSLPPDEARRRASFAYRLVFPYPEELGGAAKPGAPGSHGKPPPAPRPAAPERAKRKPAPAGEPASSF